MGEVQREAGYGWGAEGGWLWVVCRGRLVMGGVQREAGYGWGAEGG